MEYNEGDLPAHLQWFWEIMEDWMRDSCNTHMALHFGELVFPRDGYFDWISQVCRKPPEYRIKLHVASYKNTTITPSSLDLPSSQQEEEGRGGCVSVIVFPFYDSKKELEKDLKTVLF